MSEDLTRPQQVLMWELFAAGGAKLNKDILPKPEKKDRLALAKRGLVKVGNVDRSILIELEDRGWRWIADSDPFPIGDGEKRVTAERRLLQSLMRSIKRYAGENNTSIQSLFRATSKTAGSAGSIHPPGDDNDLERTIKESFFDLAGRPARGSIRLSQLREKLGHIAREKVDAALVAMWRADKANLMNLDNPRDIEDERDAAIKIGANTFHVVRIAE